MTSLQPQDPGFEERVRKVFARQGLMEAFGVAIRELDAGLCILTVDYHGNRARLQSSIQGALLGAMADTAASLAVMTLVPKGHGVVTVEYKVNFLEPAIGDHIEAAARVRRYGQTLSLVEVDTLAVDAAGADRLCAVSSHTVMRLNPPAGKEAPANG